MRTAQDWLDQCAEMQTLGVVGQACPRCSLTLGEMQQDGRMFPRQCNCNDIEAEPFNMMVETHGLAEVW